MKSVSAILLAATCLHASVVFEPNRGQTSARVSFIARTTRGAAGVNAQGVELRGRDGRRSSIRLEGAWKAAPGFGQTPAGGVSHYALGRDPARWIWGVPRYSRLLFQNVYPGIDVSYHGDRGEIEFDFLVAAGADPGRIRLSFAEPVRLADSGELQLASATIRVPRAWQTAGGRRIPVDAAYWLLSGNRAAIRLGSYDRRLPLTIDPIVSFATFLGGSDNEAETQMAVGADNAIYLAGTTLSADFPASLPAENILNRPAILLQSDAYVARFNNDGSALDWSLFIGGNSREKVISLKRDELGNLILLGSTASPDFPVTAAAYRGRIHSAMTDLFVVKLDALTGRIKTSTFLGVGACAGEKLAVDVAGGIYVAASTSGGEFQTTPGAYLTKWPPGASYGFVMRMNAAVTAPVYSTFYDLGRISAMEADSAGNLVLGGTALGDYRFPAVNPIPGLDQTPAGYFGSAYVAKLNASGSAMLFAFLLRVDGGRSQLDDLKIAPDGTIHVLGYQTGKFPQVNPFALDPLPADYTPTSDPVPFWAKLSPDGHSLIQSTMMVGPQYTTSPALPYPTSLRVFLSPGGSPCLLETGSSAFKETAGGLGGDSGSRGGNMICVNESGTGIGLKTRLPAGAAYTEVALAPDGTVLLAGIAGPGFVATTPGVLQPRFGGGVSRDSRDGYESWPSDAFLLRLSFQNPSPRVQAVKPEALILETAVSGSRGVDVSGSGFASGAEVTFNGQPVRSLFVSSTHLTLPEINFDAIRPGPNRITVSLPAPGGGTGEGVLTGINGSPATVSVSPASVLQGAGETKLVIRGTNLTRDSRLFWNGEPRAAQYVADLPSRMGHFELVLPAAGLAQPLTARLTVFVPPPGGGMSPAVVFSVLPASGASALTLSAQANPLIFGSPVTLGPKIDLFGSGFNSSTRAFWDGTEVPVELISAGRLSIQPPAGDLSRWGAHDVYLANGADRSVTQRLYIARRVSVMYSVADRVRGRLYVLGSPQQYAGPSDLLIFDLQRGDLSGTVPGAVTAAYALAVSSNGGYVYLAEGSPSLTIRRYNVDSGAVDLEWRMDNPAVGGSGSATLAAIPGYPESLIVATPSTGVTIFDRDRPRPGGSVAAGFAATDSPGFVTASRIYLASSTATCWKWMEYDAGGIGGGSPACSTETPPEAIRDGGLLYLRDGQQAYAVSVPDMYGAIYPITTALLADPAHRRAYRLAASYSYGYSVQITEFDLDSLQQRVKAQFGSAEVRELHVTGDGALLLVTGSWIALVP